MECKQKDIDLSPSAAAVIIVELEYGFVGSKKFVFVNNLYQLPSLKVLVLDLKQLHPDLPLVQLTLSNILKSPERLSPVLPGFKPFIDIIEYH